MDEATPDQWAAPSGGDPESMVPMAPPAPPAPPVAPSAADTPTTPFLPPRVAAPAAAASTDITALLPGLDAPTTSVVVDAPPKRSHKGLFVVVALLAIAGLGVGAFFLFKGDAKPTFALDKAAVNAAAARGSKSHIVTSAMGQDITMDGEVNNDTGVVHLTMSLGGSSGVNADIEAIVDGKQDVMYLGSDFFAQLGASIDTKWVKMDKKAIEAAGQDASFFDQIDLGSSVNPAAIFDKASKVEDLGFDTVEGEKVKHYAVTVAFADVAKLDKLLQQQIDQLGADMPKDMTYDMYVTEDNEIRRVTSEIDLGVGKVKVDTVQHLLAEAPVITMPDPADVTDVADLL